MNSVRRYLGGRDHRGIRESLVSPSAPVATATCSRGCSSSSTMRCRCTLTAWRAFIVVAPIPVAFLFALLTPFGIPVR